MPKVEHREGPIDINGYGIQLKLYAKKGINSSDVKEAVRIITQEIADTCMSMGAMAIGHVKSYLKADTGFIKTDTIGSKYGVHIESQLSGTIREGFFTINTIIIGLDPQKILEITLNVASKVFSKYGFEANIQETHDGHDHIANSAFAGGIP